MNIFFSFIVHERAESQGFLQFNWLRKETTDHGNEILKAKIVLHNDFALILNGKREN